jgi:hypothetical protein
MGVAKAPVGNLPLLYTPCPCVVPIIPLSGISPPAFASRHRAEWFHIRTAKLCYQSQLLPLFRMSRVVYTQRWVFCDRVLLSQHTACKFYGGELSHALHIVGYPKSAHGGVGVGTFTQIGAKWISRNTGDCRTPRACHPSRHPSTALDVRQTLSDCRAHNGIMERRLSDRGPWR